MYYSIRKNGKVYEHSCECSKLFMHAFKNGMEQCKIIVFLGPIEVIG